MPAQDRVAVAAAPHWCVFGGPIAYEESGNVPGPLSRLSDPRFAGVQGGRRQSLLLDDDSILQLRFAYARKSISVGDRERVRHGAHPLDQQRAKRRLGQAETVL